jgi:hypothetical protein
VRHVAYAMYHPDFWQTLLGPIFLNRADQEARDFASMPQLPYGNEIANIAATKTQYFVSQLLHLKRPIV